MYRNLVCVTFFALTLGLTVTSGAHPSLVGWWKFDGDFLDASGNEHHGTSMGDPAPVFAAGMFDQALDTSETNGPGYVEISNYQGILGGNPFSIAAWIYTSGNGTLVGWGSTGGGMTRVEFRINDNRLRCESSGNVQGDTTLPNDEWIHVAVTVTENAIIDDPAVLLYLNGEVDNRTSTGGAARLDLAGGFNVSIARRHSAGQRWFDGLMDDLRIYDSELTQAEIQEAMEGIGPASPELASDPSPAHKEPDVPYYVNQLSWTPGEFAKTHTVYYSTHFEDVNNASPGAQVANRIAETSLTLPPTELGSTYYWRVDEVGPAPDFTVFAGDVWRFTAEAVSYLVTSVTATANSQFSAGTGPENVVNGSGLADGLHGVSETDMWLSARNMLATIQFDFDQIHSLHEMHVWNQNQFIEPILGFGAKDVTLEVSTNGTDFVIVEGVGPLNQAPGAVDYAANTTIALNSVWARSVRMTITRGYGIIGQVGLSEVQFTAIPVSSREFSPADGVELDGLDLTLAWRAGRHAVEHRVLFGDQAAVEDGSAETVTTTEKRLPVSDLEYAQFKYWQVIDVAADGTLYPSPIMSFFTPGRAAIDDMEAYRDAENFEVWATWIDGFDDPANNGSIVGNGATGAPEMNRVYEGRQSLPMAFDTTTVAIAEATRSFDPPLDLTEGNPDSLGIYFQGSPPATTVDNGSFSVSAWGRDIWSRADEMRYVYKQLSGDGSITVRVESALIVHQWVKVGVMIRNDLTPESANSYSFATPRGRAGIQFRAVTGGTTVSTRSDNNGEIALPFWVRLTRTRDTFLGERSQDGVTWGPMFRTAIPEDPAAREVKMNRDVLIGLAVTSHNLTAGTVAVMTDVATTGIVTGDWMTVAVGGDHPASDPARVTLTVTDSAGQRHKVAHPNPAATQLTAWTQLNIPFTDMSGLNLSSIRSVTFGVEDSAAIGTVLADYLYVSSAYQPASPIEPSSAELVVHYEFEGDGTDSAGDSVATLFGNATIAADGKTGQGLNLDITPNADGVDVPGYVAIDGFYYEDSGLPAVTVATWVRLTRPRNQVLLSFDRDQYWRLEINGVGAGPGQVGWSVWTSTGQVDFGSVDRVDDGLWHHVAGVFDRGVLRLYIDGVPQPSVRGGETFGRGNVRYGYIGTGSESTAFNLAPRTPAAHPEGDMDDVRIYHRALSPAEISWLAGL